MHPSRREFIEISGAALLTAAVADAGEVPNAVKVPTTDEAIRKLAEDAPLAMKFGGSTADECRKWQGEFAAKLRSLLGPHKPPVRWKTTVESSADLDDHRREALVLTAEGHPPLPVYLLTPLKKAERPRAGVLAIHGHGAYGYDPVAGRDDLRGAADEIKHLNYDYGRQLVRRGYVVAVPCLTPFGRRLGKGENAGKLDPCADAFLRLQMFGKLLIAENLRDCLWSLDLLAQHEQVDGKRLGCVGLSYGGRMTMLTTALEPRVRVAVVSGALNVMQERIAKPYSCGAQIIPGLLNIGDVPEVGLLIAPRPCVWETGLDDELIPTKWADIAIARMRTAYKALGAEDQLKLDCFMGGHQWSGHVAYPVLEKVLGQD
jgi:dienelactone hydrolase